MPETHLSKKETAFKEAIHNFEDLLIPHPKIELIPTHYFCEGLYVRELFIPKDTLLTGKKHRHEHIAIISKGILRTVTKEGLEEIHALRTMVVSAGTKRALYAITDVIWTTIHDNPTNERDMDKLEELFIEPEQPLEEREIEYMEQLKIGGVK